MASIVQRGSNYSVVYYTKENGIRKQKWESFRTEKEALHRKCMVEQYQQVKKELAHRPQTVGQLIQEYVWLYGRAKWSLSMYESSLGLIRGDTVLNFLYDKNIFIRIFTGIFYQS